MPEPHDRAPMWQSSFDTDVLLDEDAMWTFHLGSHVLTTGSRQMLSGSCRWAERLIPPVYYPLWIGPRPAACFITSGGGRDLQ